QDQFADRWPIRIGFARGRRWDGTVGSPIGDEPRVFLSTLLGVESPQINVATVDPYDAEIFRLVMTVLGRGLWTGGHGGSPRSWHTSSTWYYRFRTSRPRCRPPAGKLNCFRRDTLGRVGDTGL